MKSLSMKDMKRGWFIGSFEPAALKTDLCEAAVKLFSTWEDEKADGLPFDKIVRSRMPPAYDSTSEPAFSTI